ncbi:MAG: hypothetical protein Q7T32_06270 [Moraxellaceae bacterium]|nr:hypothetical protein [Moraxellaceae bacterium]
MKSVIGCFLIGAVAFSSTGCSTIKTNELTTDESQILKEKSVALSKYDKLPDFAAQTAANVQFGLLGLATAISNGNKIINKNNIEDPALSISRQLAEGLKSNHNVKIIESNEYVSAKSQINDLVTKYAGHDFVLDVKTVGWNSIYFPSDWDSYRVMYSAHARLIDIKSKQVVAEEVCTHVPEYADTNQAPSYNDLENGTGLKASLEKSVEYCVEHIRNMAKLHQANKEKLAVSQ